MNNELTQMLAYLTAKESGVEQKIAEYQQQIEEIREQRKAVETTIALLAQETLTFPLNGSVIYKKAKLGDAVLHCVNRFGQNGVTRQEVMKHLTDHGFKYAGAEKNFYSSVSITLNRLHQDKKQIACIEKNGAKRYLPKTPSSEITGAASGAV